MKKRGIGIIIIVIIFYLIIFVASDSNTVPSVNTGTPSTSSGTITNTPVTTPQTSSTTPLGKIDRTIGDTETPIGELVGFGKSRDQEVIAKNIRIIRNEKDLTSQIIINNGGYIKIKHSDGVVREYSNLQSVKVRINNIDYNKEPQIFIDRNGKITEAFFTSERGGKYLIGNEEIEIPKGSSVALKDNKAVISYLQNTRVIPPKKIKNEDSETEYSFKSSDGGFLELENGEKFKGTLHYSNGKYYFTDKEVVIGDILVKNPNNIKTYLEFSGEASKVNGPYVSINTNLKKITIGTNTNQDSPGFMFNKNNAFGIFLENTDHFSVKAIGGGKGSYITIQDRTKDGLIAKGDIVGSVAIDEDNRGIISINDKVYLKITGRYMSEFSEFSGTTTVPIELEYKKYEGDNIVPVFNQGQKIVISNRMELGVGSEPAFIRGTSYYRDYPLLTRGISNRITYNYVPYTSEGFMKYTELGLSMDSYSASRMTPNKYRMLIDIANSLTQKNKNYLKEIEISRAVYYDGDPVLAVGGPGGINIAIGALDPGTIRHEMTHAITIGLGNRFWNDWIAVGGGKVAFTSDYGSSDREIPYEDAAEFGGEFLYKSPSYTSKYLNNHRYSRYYRGKMVVLYKHGVISKQELDTHFLSAGLQTDDASLQRYISEAMR